MRAKYINKQARRRTIRPDGDHYREMRKWRGDARERQRRILLVGGGVLVVGVVVCVIYLVWMR